jgi:hypothetical protein
MLLDTIVLSAYMVVMAFWFLSSLRMLFFPCKAQLMAALLATLLHETLLQLV